MTLRYVGIQVGVFAAIVVAGSLLLGFGLPVLAAGLLLSLGTVLTVAALDARAGRYRHTGENLFASLTDAQLRECYHAYNMLIRGGSSRSMLFYKLLTRYDEADENGFDNAAEDLLMEIGRRWHDDGESNSTFHAG